MSVATVDEGSPELDDRGFPRFWDAERETVFGGDLFLGVRVRVAHPGEDPRQLARSVRADEPLVDTDLERSLS